MYASMDFATKKELRLAVRQGVHVIAYSPVMAMPAITGKVLVEGPWPKRAQVPDAPVFGPQPKPHTRKTSEWRALCEVRDMQIVKVH